MKKMHEVNLIGSEETYRISPTEYESLLNSIENKKPFLLKRLGILINPSSISLVKQIEGGSWYLGKGSPKPVHQVDDVKFKGRYFYFEDVEIDGYVMQNQVELTSEQIKNDMKSEADFIEEKFYNKPKEPIENGDVDGLIGDKKNETN